MFSDSCISDLFEQRLWKDWWILASCKIYLLLLWCFIEQVLSIKILIQGESSESWPLNMEVWRGSVLLSRLLTLNSAEIFDNAHKHGLRVHVYGNDTQLCSFTSGDAVVAVTHMKDCVAEIKAWLVVHKLKLNDDKSVIMEILPPRTMGISQDRYVMVGDNGICLWKAERNLGVTLDQNLNIQAEICQHGLKIVTRATEKPGWNTWCLDSGTRRNFGARFCHQ